MTEKRFTHKDKSLYIDDDYFCELEDGDEITELLNRQQYTVETVWKENEQLKQRNDRQAKQLDRLYRLIEEKDWRALSDILDDFKRCEEQLQKEWKCYE